MRFSPLVDYYYFIITNILILKAQSILYLGTVIIAGERITAIIKSGFFEIYNIIIICIIVFETVIEATTIII